MQEMTLEDRRLDTQELNSELFSSCSSSRLARANLELARAKELTGDALTSQPHRWLEWTNCELRMISLLEAITSGPYVGSWSSTNRWKALKA